MHFLNYFYNKNLKFDLINKFHYANLKKLPKLKKIILNLNCKTTNLKTLGINLLALELITNQKGKLIISKEPNLLLKLRKGNPRGCKLVLKSSIMLIFFLENLNKVVSNTKNFNSIKIYKKVERKSFSFVIKNILSFSELSENYSLFSSLSYISLSFITNAKTKKELIFFLKSLQFPIN